MDWINNIVLNTLVDNKQSDDNNVNNFSKGLKFYYKLNLTFFILTVFVFSALN